MAERRDVVRTKKSIEESFLSLCKEKKSTNVTVREIIDRADISRGTFYAHYLDVIDLREKIERRFIDETFSIDSYIIEDIASNPEKSILNVYRAFIAEKELILAITGCERSSAFFYRCRMGLENILLNSAHISDDEKIYSRIDSACAAVIMESVERVLFSDKPDLSYEAAVTASLVRGLVYSQSIRG